jgi:threonine dehydrogenase-like Zn-dependent dehydrogenase
MHSLDRTALAQGETVFVAGPGPIGFAIALAAMGSGSGQVFISGLESDEYRLKLASEQGIIPIVVGSNETDERPIDAVRRMTNGRGVDVAYEVSGTPGGLDQCMGVSRRGGRIGMVGQGFTPASLAAGTVSYMEISLIGVRGGTPRIWQKAGAFLLRNSNLIKNLVTHQVPLSKGVEAFQTMLAGKGMKILLLPGS